MILKTNKMRAHKVHLFQELSEDDPDCRMQPDFVNDMLFSYEITFGLTDLLNVITATIRMMKNYIGLKSFIHNISKLNILGWVNCKSSDSCLNLLRHSAIPSLRIHSFRNTEPYQIFAEMLEIISMKFFLKA